MSFHGIHPDIMAQRPLVVIGPNGQKIDAGEAKTVLMDGEDVVGIILKPHLLFQQVSSNELHLLLLSADLKIEIQKS